MPRVFHRHDSPFNGYSSTEITEPWPRGVTREVSDERATYLTSTLPAAFIFAPSVTGSTRLPTQVPQDVPERRTVPIPPGRPIGHVDPDELAEKEAEMETPPELRHPNAKSQARRGQQAADKRRG